MAMDVEPATGGEATALGPALSPPPDDVLVRLRKVHGTRPRVRHSTPVLDAVIACIISQSTTHIQAVRATAELHQQFANWNDVRRATIEEVAERIRPAGLAQRKATRILALLRWMYEERGWRSLEHLRTLPPGEARAILLELPGIGPRSAARVMSFVLGTPDFPLDTHVLRIVRRLGWAPAGLSTESTYAYLVPRLLDEHKEELHLLLLAHARSRCRAKRPQCHNCPLVELCPSATPPPEADAD
jgi:endonuclease-3